MNQLWYLKETKLNKDFTKYDSQYELYFKKLLKQTI